MVLAFYSDNPSSNPADYYYNGLYEKIKIKQIETWGWPNFCLKKTGSGLFPKGLNFSLSKPFALQPSS